MWPSPYMASGLTMEDEKRINLLYVKVTLLVKYHRSSMYLMYDKRF